MSKINEALLGQSLDGYRITRMTEVFKTNEDGRKMTVLGYFASSEIAAAWAENQRDKNWNKTCDVLVITNGERFFLFQGEEITVHDDEEAALEVRKAALAKLSDAERAVLGV